jgi:hypothetical protein
MQNLIARDNIRSGVNIDQRARTQHSQKRSERHTKSAFPESLFGLHSVNRQSVDCFGVSRVTGIQGHNHYSTREHSLVDLAINP